MAAVTISTLGVSPSVVNDTSEKENKAPVTAKVSSSSGSTLSSMSTSQVATDKLPSFLRRDVPQASAIYGTYTPAPSSRGLPTVSLRTVAPVKIHEKHKKLDHKPKSKHHSISSKQLALEYGEFLKSVDVNSQAYKLYVSVVGKQKERHFHKLRIRSLHKNCQNAVEVYPETGVIKIPHCKPNILHITHFIYGLVMTADDEKVSDVDKLAIDGKLSEEQFVEARARLHYQIVCKHSAMIQELLTIQPEMPKEMDLFGDAIKIWNGDFAAFFKSIDSSIYHLYYKQQILAEQKKKSEGQALAASS